MTPPLHWPATDPGQCADQSRIEASATMHALVYYGKGDYRVVTDRPIICTEHDVIAKINLVHRCGTDVKIFQSGRPDQAEESLLQELAAILASPHSGNSLRFLDYVRLLETGQADAAFEDPLYRDAAAYLKDSTPADRAALWNKLRLFWGRIFGHEIAAEVVRVGSKVHELKEGIGYMQGQTLGSDYLGFHIGERITLQSRIAHYHPPATSGVGGGGCGPNTRGVQLLGGNITDLAMNQGGAFSQYVRIRPQVIQSGSVLRIPAGLDHISAALVEPLGCLLDCFQKTTHEIGQDDTGSILRKGVMPGGLTLVIGSGSMAMMAGILALSSDPIIQVGGARQVVFAVRSAQKRDLVLRVMNDPRVACIVCDNDQQLPQAIAAQFTPSAPDPYGRSFKGFDDVILAAGNAKTVAVAHALICPTGARIMTFAGTRGESSIESGVWHYANAGVLGTSGCNTKMMEIGLGMLSRKSIDLHPLSGKTYSFADLQQEGTSAFFTDQHLRPKLDPNLGLPPIKW